METKSARRALLVADSNEMFFVWHESLRRLPCFDVVGAGGLGEALELFQAGSYDLVVLDYNVSGQDAVEYISALREIDAAVPIVWIASRPWWIMQPAPEGCCCLDRPLSIHDFRRAVLCMLTSELEQ